MVYRRYDDFSVLAGSARRYTVVTSTAADQQYRLRLPLAIHGSDAGNRFSSVVVLKSLHKFVAYRLRCTTIAVSFVPVYTVISTRYSVCCRGFYAKMYFALPPAPGRGVSGV